MWVDKVIVFLNQFLIKFMVMQQCTLRVFHQQMVKLFEATNNNLHAGLSEEQFGDILAEVDDLKITYNCADGKLLHVN